MSDIQTLKDWIQESDNIVFFGGLAFLPKVIFLIFVAIMDCTKNNIAIPLNR